MQPWRAITLNPWLYTHHYSTLNGWNGTTLVSFVFVLFRCRTDRSHLLAQTDLPGEQKCSQIQTPHSVSLCSTVYVFPQSRQLGLWYEEPGTPLCSIFGESGRLGQQKHHSWATILQKSNHLSRNFPEGWELTYLLAKIANLGIQRYFSAKTGAELPCT